MYDQLIGCLPNLKLQEHIASLLFVAVDCEPLCRFIQASVSTVSPRHFSLPLFINHGIFPNCLTAVSGDSNN
jgi:hypothetical protein